MQSLSDSEYKRKTRHQLITEYVKGGYRLFPTSKHVPIEPGWKDTPYDENLKPASLPKEFGVAFQIEDFCIDYDPERRITDNDLVSLYKDLELPMPLPTFKVHSGGDGWHIYFKKPINTANALYMFDPKYPSIEYKSYGRYVIGAGSIHKDTKEYYINFEGSAMQVSIAPERLLEHATRKEILLSQYELDQLDKPDNIAQYIDYLKTRAPLAIEGNAGDATTYNVACYGHDYGLSEAVTLELMALHYNTTKCHPAWGADELAKKVSNAYNYCRNSSGNKTLEAAFTITPDLVMLANQYQQQTRLDNNEDAVDWDFVTAGARAYLDLKDTLNNAEGMLRARRVKRKHTAEYFDNPLQHLVRYNLFTERVELTKCPPWSQATPEYWRKTDTLQLKHWLSRFTPLNASTESLKEAVQVHAMQTAYHPVKEYLESIVWDGTPRLNGLLKNYLNVIENEYTIEVGKNTLIGGVARIYEPGCQNDSSMVIEDEQGEGKSSFCRILGGKWYGNLGKIDPTNKETAIKLVGKWLVELAEIDKMTRKFSASEIKDWLTMLEDTYKPLYETNAIDQKRRCFFIGSTNPDGSGYLTDPTGNRRFWIIRANGANLDKLREDRDQLWAEAVHRFKAGEPHYITDPYTEAIARKEQLARLEQDPLTEMLGIYLAANNKSAVTLLDAAEALGLYGMKLSKVEGGRIVRALTQLGYDRIRTWDSNSKIQTWLYVKNMGV